MTTGAIIIGMVLAFIAGICITISLFYKKEPLNKVILGIFAGALFGLAFRIQLADRFSIPSALDVYRGNTELEITSVNGVPTDTVVVFKKTGD